MKNNSLNYHLAYALMHLINIASGQIYDRLNVTIQVLNHVRAMKENAKGLNDLFEDSKLLRECYEPEMDSAEYTYTKRIAFEIELDSLQYGLLKIINENNLVTQSIMQEVIVGRFNKIDGDN